MRRGEVQNLGMLFDLIKSCSSQCQRKVQKGRVCFTSRIARKKDSILPAESPRVGAVCNKTAPMLLHEGYAKWNIAVASAAARRRSSVRCEELRIDVCQSHGRKLDARSSDRLRGYNRCDKEDE